jgi:hypothetical protein
MRASVFSLRFKPPRPGDSKTPPLLGRRSSHGRGVGRMKAWNRTRAAKQKPTVTLERRELRAPVQAASG